jgi:hypothetical protein
MSFEKDDSTVWRMSFSRVRSLADKILGLPGPISIVSYFARSDELLSN